MSLQVGGSVSLTHFLTDLHQGGSTPSQILKKNVTSIERKAFVFNALEKICYVALLAIMAAIFAVSYTTAVLTPGLTLVMAGMALSTPLIMLSLHPIVKRAQQWSRLAHTERQVYLQLKQIERWDSSQVESFLKEQHVDLKRIPLDHLRRLNPQAPLCALLPLIARFNYYSGRFREIEAGVQKALPAQEAHFAKRETEEGKPADPREKQKIRFESWRTARNQLELNGAPSFLYAEVMRRLLQTPSNRELDIQPEAYQIRTVGLLAPMEPAARAFHRTYSIPNDDYLLFFDGRPSLSLSDIERNAGSPHKLQPVLFPEK
ncbi:MAG: hypothetical protein WCF19_08120 [Chlamydiales bacterium]